MWDPRPTVKTQGGVPRPIQLGDVGYMDSSGLFHCVFNIFDSVDQNALNGLCAPKDHIPLDWPSYFIVDDHSASDYVTFNCSPQGLVQDRWVILFIAI